MSKEKQAQGPPRPFRPPGLESIRPPVTGTDLGGREHRLCRPPAADSEPSLQTFGTATARFAQLADFLRPNCTARVRAQRLKHAS